MKTLMLLAGLLAVVGVVQDRIRPDGIKQPGAQQQLSKRPIQHQLNAQLKNTKVMYLTWAKRKQIRNTKLFNYTC
jgi:hypothetical protein